MAITCSPQAVTAGAECFDCGLNHKQLLASMVYLLCQINGMSYTPAQLANLSECYNCSLTEKRLLAAIVYLLCSGGAAGGVGQIVEYTTTPTADGVVPGNLNAPAIAVKPGGTTYIWDPVAHVWDDH